MKILSASVEDRNLGSCRIRYYSFLENLPTGCSVKPYKKGAEGDVVYIQKTAKEWTIKIAKDAKKRGIPVVFDRDDFNEKWNPLHTVIMDLADAVTTDTEMNAKIAREHTGTPVYVVRDCIDYGIGMGDRDDIRESISRVVTFGRQKNVESIAPYYSKVPCSTSYICDREFKVLKKSKFIEWNRKTFIKKIQKHDAVILTHNIDWRVPNKSNARMIVAMALGIPVLSTPSPEFERTLNSVGHPELLIRSPKDVPKILKAIDSLEVRRKISNDFFEYAWNYYKPEVSSVVLFETMKGVINV